MFSLLNQTRTRAGALLLKQWLTFPSLDQQLLHDRQSHVAYLTFPSNSDVATSLSNTVSGIKNMARVVTKFRCVVVR